MFFFVRLLVTSRNICDLWRKTRNETPIYSMVSVALQLLYLLPTSVEKGVILPHSSEPSRGAWMFDKKSSTKTHIKYMSNYQSQIFFGSYELTSLPWHTSLLSINLGPPGPPSNVRMFGTAPAQIAPPSVLVELWASICWVAARQFGAAFRRGVDKLEDSAELINIHWLIYPFNNR